MVEPDLILPSSLVYTASYVESFAYARPSIRLYRHDYWKKFGALQTFGAQCEDNNNMSVVGFVLIGLIPPALTPGVRWESLPEGRRSGGCSALRGSTCNLSLAARGRIDLLAQRGYCKMQQIFVFLLFFALVFTALMEGAGPHAG